MEPGAGTDAGDEPAGEELTTIAVGVVPVVDVAPLYLGIDQGFFEEEGLDVQPATLITATRRTLRTTDYRIYPPF